MKLTKVRIFNYKSIADSGDIDFTSDFLTLVGKNESGKTAILEALRDFDREQYVVPENAYPLSRINEEPLLEMHFKINREELAAIEQGSSMKITDDVRNYLLEKGLRLTKSALGEYDIKDAYLDGLFNDLTQNRPEEQPADGLQSKKQELDDVLGGFPIPELVLTEGPEALDGSVQAVRRAVKSRLLSIRDEHKQERIVNILRDLTKEANEADHTRIQGSARAVFIHSVVQQLPRFLFFSDFSDILPFEIAIDSLKENRAVLDFARISDLDLDAVMETKDLQRRINILNRHSATISGEFLDYWEQNQIELIVRTEGDKLLFGVKETGSTEFFKVEQRSKGFQWFLSFYLRLNSFKNTNVVVLIDEPGMTLHPTAQKDILKVLEKKASDRIQVVFSTHSSYLIDPSRLDRVRLIVKDPASGTIVEDNIHADIDEDTMLPVRVALGSRFSQNAPRQDVQETKENIKEEEQNKDVEEKPVEAPPARKRTLFGFGKKKEEKPSEIVKKITQKAQAAAK